MTTSAPTYAEFVESYPEFAGVAQGTVTTVLTISASILSATAWGSYYSIAVGLDAAHKLALRALQGTGVKGGFQAAVGPISSVSAAGVSTSFNSPAASEGSLDEDWYKKTVYGQELLRLRSITITPGALAC